MLPFYPVNSYPDPGHGNPGQNRVRMALVASTEECVEAALRIKQFIASLYRDPGQ